MKIAIDLTQIPDQLTGVGYYMENMIKTVAKFDRENQYYLFIREPIRQIFQVQKGNFNYLIVPSYPFIFRVLWEQLVLPLRLLRLRCQVLHSPHYTTPLFGWWFKRVVTFPDMTFYLFPEKHLKYKVFYFQNMIKLSSRLADRIISISDATTKDIVKLIKVARKKIKTIHLAVSSNYQPGLPMEVTKNVLERYHLPGKYLLFVGTIEPRKNILGLLEGYFQIRSDLKATYRLVIVGKKGWHYQEIFDYLANHPEKARVIFTDYVPEADLPYIYGGASLFIYPSFYEGFGIPVLEAISCGIPTITSDLSSMPEVVGNGGLLINPGKNDTITQAIERILTDKELAQTLRSAGLKQALKFSWDKCARETLCVYTEGTK